MKWDWSSVSVFVFLFSSRRWEQAGLGVRFGSGAAGHDPLQHPGHPAVLESGRTIPQTVQGGRHPDAHQLPGRNTTRPGTKLR